MHDFLCIFFKHFCYPVGIVLIALELHRYIYMNPNCGHRLADYTED